jgi:hypothetical protein
MASSSSSSLSWTVVSGYKIFGPDWVCKGFKYSTDKPNHLHSMYILKMYTRGFHFCREAIDCLRFTDFGPGKKYAKVKAVGQVDESTDDMPKCVTDCLVIEEELTEPQFKALCTGTITDVDGYTLTYLKGELHSDDDKPSKVLGDSMFSDQTWHSHGVEHRVKGPAFIHRSQWCLEAVWKMHGDRAARVGLNRVRITSTEIIIEEMGKRVVFCFSGKWWFGPEDLTLPSVDVKVLCTALNNTNEGRYWDFVTALFNKWIAE